MEWQPLSVREGRRPPFTLEDGMPPRLRHPVRYWLEGAFGYQDPGPMRVSLMLNVAAANGIDLPRGASDTDIMESIFDSCDAEPDLYLSVVDTILHQGHVGKLVVEPLRHTLRAGYSVWTVAEDRRSLVRRVDPAAEASFVEALATGGTAKEELLHAWEKAYGREPDPSDCWDHSIKAVEAALVPIVVPNQDRPQLGHVVGQLESHPDRWRLILGDDVRPLVSMLRLLWPNPDRHGSQEQRRVPSSEEAESVLHLAVTIVQWSRKDVLQRRT